MISVDVEFNHLLWVCVCESCIILPAFAVVVVKDNTFDTPSWF